MRFTSRDGIATLFVVVAAAMFGLWVSGTAMTGISTRVMTVVVFALGWAACMADQRQMAAVYGADRSARAAPIGYVVTSSVLGGLALVTGIFALVTASELALAVLATAMVALWLLATARHALAPSGPARSA